MEESNFTALNINVWAYTFVWPLYQLDNMHKWTNLIWIYAVHTVDFLHISVVQTCCTIELISTCQTNLEDHSIYYRHIASDLLKNDTPVSPTVYILSCDVHIDVVGN